MTHVTVSFYVSIFLVKRRVLCYHLSMWQMWCVTIMDMGVMIYGEGCGFSSFDVAFI